MDWKAQIDNELGCCNGDWCDGSNHHNKELIAFIESLLQQKNVETLKLLEEIMEAGKGKWDSDWDHAVGEKIKKVYPEFKRSTK